MSACITTGSCSCGKRGARAMGVEFNPDMVALSNREAVKAGVTDKVKFVNGDIFATDFSQASVITLYLLPSLNLRLALELKQLGLPVILALNMMDAAEKQGLEVDAAELSGTVTVLHATMTRELDSEMGLLGFGAAEAAAGGAITGTTAETGIPLTYEVQVLAPQTLRVDSTWPSPSTSRYNDNAGRASPSSNVNASIAAGGNMVILSPGKYTVDRRARAAASSGDSGAMPSAGAAI